MAELVSRAYVKDPVSAEEARWRTVRERRAGDFVYAVKSTGVFCRPGCSSRRPRRENVRFFDSARAARRAGFRACLRCRPELAEEPDSRTERLERACRYIEAQAGRVPSLAELAAHVGCSASHLQRLFKGHLGLTPREYADALRSGELRRRLRAGETILDALQASGYGSTSRLYEGAGAQLGMTPGAYRKGAERAAVRYGIGRSPLGPVLVAKTERGVCFVAMAEGPERLRAALRRELPRARLEEDASFVRDALQPVLDFLSEGRALPALPLDIRATAFQRRVWETLRRVPAGERIGYGELARALGRPGAARAVARACATNPAALFVPCHRATGARGRTGGYRWGAERKRKLLALEERTKPTE